MVAEPVQATVQALNFFFDSSRQFLVNQKEAISQSEYTDKLLQLNPFTSTNPKPAIMNSNHSNDSIVDALCNHLTKKRIVVYCGILTIGIGFSAVSYFDKRRHGQKLGSSIISSGVGGQHKRRVPKLANGARRDVVLVVGSPTEPMTRLIALDFEKRGFIVYLTILDVKDFKYVELNPITDDINYLNLNDSFSYDIQLIKFQELLDTPVVPFPGAKSHKLRFLGCVFAPSLYFPMGPIENITVASWLKIIERLQVILKLLSSGLISLIRQHQPYCKLLVITSNIVSSLNLPYHAPETFYQKSVQNLFMSLTREVQQHNISITQVKLGNLNITNNPSGTSSPQSSSTSSSVNLVNSEIRSWNDEMRDLYANNFSKSHIKSNPIKNYSRSSMVGTTNLRDLYHVLFDLLYPTDVNKLNPSVVYCGSGARIYDWLAGFLPESLISWLLI